MIATSPNHDGVEGTDCGEVWISTFEASGLKLYDRLKQISASIRRVAEQKGAFQNRFYAYSSF